MSRNILLIDINNYFPIIMKTIDENKLHFFRMINTSPEEIFDLDDLFEYAILKSLSGVLGKNLIRDYLHTEVFDIFYSTYLEAICLQIALNIVKTNNLNFLIGCDKIKSLVTYSEIIFVYYRNIA